MGDPGKAQGRVSAIFQSRSAHETSQDYSLRAQNYNEKKRHLKILRQKAADRNPDEFHFAMMNAQTRDGGVKVANRGNEPLGQAVTRLLKTQDAGYLRTVAQKTRKAIQQLQQKVTLDDTGDRLRALNDSEDETHTRLAHVTFVDSVEDQAQWPNRIAKFPEQSLLSPKESNTDNATGGCVKVSQRHSASGIPPVQRDLREARAQRKRRNRESGTRKATLEALIQRDNSLRVAQRELEIQRSKMSNSNGNMTTKEGLKFTVKGRKR